MTPARFAEISLDTRRKIMKDKLILWLIRFLLVWLDGYHLHRDPKRRQKNESNY